VSGAAGPLLPAGVDVYLVEEQANPSTDYFMLPACAEAGARVHRCSFGQLPERAALRGAVVVFVRYLPAPWMTLVESLRDQLAGVALFMDDDLLDPRAAAGMPWRYRWKLYRLATRHAGWLRRQQVALWVSTPWLARKYAQWAPLLVPPRAVAERTEPRRVFYHGTASHGAEIRWLRPVIGEVLRADERVVFEIIGGHEVQQLYRGLPRVTIVHPMKWPAYQAFMDLQGRHIGLAPLLDLPFNRARSFTKFFDITRCGAVGLYSADGACAEVVTDGVNGLLLPARPQAWVDAILALAADEPRRLEMLRNAQASA
jgi:hypothetical protein